MRDRRLTILAIVVSLCATALFLYHMGRGEQRFSWYENYRANNDQPYGALFIRKMLETYRSDAEFTLNTKQPVRFLLEDVREPGETDYVFIGQSLHLDTGSVTALAGFLEAGGNAFIASVTPPDQILDVVYYAECGNPVDFVINRATSVKLDFYHETVKKDGGIPFAFRIRSRDVPYDWVYLDEDLFCDATVSLAALGYQDTSRVNFIRISFGKGNLYLHTNPIVFTNYFMTQEHGLNYASAVFSHLDGRDIIWDEFSKVAFFGETPYNSPLYFLLDQTSLKYAWWLLLVTILLYVLFAAKRRQRVIPVLEPKANTSLEFVNIVSRLYYENGNHLDMARKKMRYFLYFVRSRYGIHAERFGEEHIRRLAGKARLDVSDIEIIFSRYQRMEDQAQDNINVGRLMDLYDAIDNFYTKAK